MGNGGALELHVDPSQLNQGTSNQRVALLSGLDLAECSNFDFSYPTLLSHSLDFSVYLLSILTLISEVTFFSLLSFSRFICSFRRLTIKSDECLARKVTPVYSQGRLEVLFEMWGDGSCDPNSASPFTLTSTLFLMALALALTWRSQFFFFFVYFSFLPYLPPFVVTLVPLVMMYYFRVRFQMLCVFF